MVWWRRRTPWPERGRAATAGRRPSEVLSDDWTVITTDGTWSSNWEHSQGPLVLTAPDGGRAKLAEFGITAAPDPLA